MPQTSSSAPQLERLLGTASAPAHDQAAGEVRLGWLAGLDLGEDRLDQPLARTRDILLDGGERRGRQARGGDIVETDHRDVARNLAPRPRQCAHRPDRDQVARGEDRIEIAPAGDQLAGGAIARILIGQRIELQLAVRLDPRPAQRLAQPLVA